MLHPTQPVTPLAKRLSLQVSKPLLAAVIGGVCVGLLAASMPTGAQKPRSRADKTVPPRKNTSVANSGLPAMGKPVPAFTLADTEGHTHTLAELKGRSIALYFFCGCERCQRCAQTWGQLQKGGALTSASAQTGATTAAGDTRPPNTVVVFMGDAAATRNFAATTGLDAQQTLMLPDPQMQVTQKYHALPCPRAFALDAKGTVRYVNSHKDDDPLKAAAATIVTRTLEALTGADQQARAPR